MYLQQSRAAIQAAFCTLVQQFPAMMGPVAKALAACEPELALAAQALYTACPLSDAAACPAATMLDFAQNGLWLWRHVPQLRALPEQMYLDYVLSHRVNEEEIRPCRQQMRKALAGRLAGLGQSQAVAEVNFWCAEQVTYQSGDERTLSALAVWQRGYGRCGEESVFLVNALRSVGIPARQVYAPYWSHCDDNHAWVEVWCEGAWHFTGACEPRLALDSGWFNGAAARAMLVHSRLFGPATPPGEQPIAREDAALVLNQLGRYAPTRTVQVRVLHPSGAPAAGVQVAFQVLNYAAWRTIARMHTGADGAVQLRTGFGSLRVSAFCGQDNTRAAGLLGPQQGALALTLAAPAQQAWQAVDMLAPADVPGAAAPLTPWQKQEGARRLAEANQKRNAAKAGWQNPELAAFLARPDPDGLRAALAGCLTAKDRTDCVCAVLEEHLAAARPWRGSCPWEVFVPCLLSPRVEHEPLRRWRNGLAQAFAGERQRLRAQPALLWQQISRRVRALPMRERSTVITPPLQCLRAGVGTLRAQKVLFVAAARALGIPARLAPVTGAMEYWQNGWHTVLPQQAPCARLTLCAGDDTAWSYGVNWSLARIEQGEDVVLDAAALPWQGEGGSRALSLALCPGWYRLVTANRLPNGNIFAWQACFALAKGQTRTETLPVRRASLQQMLARLPLPPFALYTPDGQRLPGGQLLAAGRSTLLLWLEEGCEPTAHILSEIEAQAAAFAALGSRVCFVVCRPQAARHPAVAAVLARLPAARLLWDKGGESLQLLARRMYADPDTLPLALVADGSQNGIFASGGYRVGSGALLLRILQTETGA